MEAWQRNAPEGMTPRLEWLRGEAVVDRVGSDSWVDGYPASALPADPALRFLHLFQRRPQWLGEELEPYLV